MKGTPMTTDWRTVQLFLDDLGVAEVEADAEDYSNMRCSCASFAKSKKCKHARWVRRSIDDNGGSYAIKLPEDISDEAILEAMQDKDSFRKLIVEHGTIEVI